MIEEIRARFNVDAQILSFAEPLKELGDKVGLDCRVHKEAVHPTLGLSGRTFQCGQGDAFRYHGPLLGGVTYMTAVVRAKIADFPASTICIIDDVRFLEEHTMLKAKGAIFVGVKRKDAQVPWTCLRWLYELFFPLHRSETEMLQFPDPEFVLDNNSDLAFLKLQIGYLLNVLI